MECLAIFPVEVWARGFPAQSSWKLLQNIGITWPKRKASIKVHVLADAAERESCWLWYRREEPTWRHENSEHWIGHSLQTPPTRGRPVTVGVHLMTRTGLQVLTIYYHHHVRTELAVRTLQRQLSTVCQQLLTCPHRYSFVHRVVHKMQYPVSWIQEFCG